MNNFIMFIGLPGMGKTTFIDENQGTITSTYGVDAVISSDAVIEDIAAQRGLTYSEVFQDSVKPATEYVNVMINLLSLQQRNFILDQTNLTVKSREKKLNRLWHKQNYNKIAVVFNDLNEEELDKRLYVRAQEEGKIISKQLIADFRARFELPSISEGFNHIFSSDEFKKTLAPKYGEMKFA